MTQVETERAPESKPQPNNGKSTTDPPDYIPDPLFACWMAINNAHNELDNTLRLLDAIEAVVYERDQGGGENLVLSEADATSISYLKRTIQLRLIELSDVLKEQTSVLNELSSEDSRPEPATTERPTPNPPSGDPEQPAGTGDEKPAATTDTKLHRDDKQVRIAQCMAGERVTASHWFSGWATVIRNVLPVLHAITCFTDEDERETAYDDQDGIGVDQMALFAQKELEALAEHCDRAGDASNPRFITPSGRVWKLEAEAVLIEKSETAKGGVS